MVLRAMRIAALVLVAAGFIFAGTIHAQQRPHCFENAGLKDLVRISYATDNAGGRNFIRGAITVEREYDAARQERFPFTGKLSGITLNIRFAANVAPEFIPPKRESHSWQLIPDGGRQSLQVEQYGRNYDSGNYANYMATYTPCG